MRLKLFIGLILLCLISILIYKKYYNPSSAELLLQYTPDSCNTIILINASSIQNKLLLDGIQHFSQIDSLRKAFTDEKLNILFQQAFESSIVLNNQIIAFEYKGFNGIVFEYTDNSKLQTYFQNTLVPLYEINIDTNLQFIQFKNYPITLSWTKKHLYLLQHKEKTIIERLVKNAARTLTKTDSLLLQGFPDNDVSIFSNNHFNIDSIPVIKYIHHFYATINFEKGKIQLNTNFQFNIGKQSYYSSLFNTGKKNIQHNNSSPLSFSVCINPTSFFKQKDAAIWWDKAGLNDNTIKCWNGQFCYVYEGMDTIQQQIVTYEYDDDFNKIEVIKNVAKNIHKHKLAVGYANSKLLDSVFFSLKKDKLINDKQGKIQVINTFDQAYFISNNSEWLCISGTINDTSSFKAKQKTSIFEFNLSPQGLQADFIKRFASKKLNYDALQFKHINFSFKQSSNNNYNANLTITFNSELNGLFELGRNIQGFSFAVN